MLAQQKNMLLKNLGCSQVLLAFVAIVLPSLESHTMGCPARCECNAQQRSVVCHRRKMQNVPEGIPTETKILDLSKNLLGSIRQARFASFSELEFLELNENLISNIEPGAFSKLPFLQSLSLRSNRLKLIQLGVFSSLSNLTSLDISENKIVILLDYMFEDLKRLERLEVGDNDLVYISRHAFSGLHSLRELTLEHCNLTAVPTEAFHSLHNLVTLRLRHLNIASVPPLAFRHLPKLRELELSHWASLESLLPRSFQSLNLTSLSLTHTNLTAVPHDALRPLINLRVLNLSSNPISIIESRTFSLLSHLQEIHLSGALLCNIEAHAFHGLKKLKVINFARNQLQTLEQNAFEVPGSIQVLRLDGNPLACDCRLLWILQRRQKMSFEEKPPICSKPARARGMSFRDLSDKLLHNYFICQKPHITVKKQRHQVAIEGQLVFIQCHADGDPAPSISWISPWKQRITYKSSGRMTLLQDGTLQIRYAQIVDSGSYVCIASNAGGNDTHRSILTVKRFPSQSLTFNNGTLMYMANDYNGTDPKSIDGLINGEYDIMTVLVAIAIGCFTFLGVVLVCLLILFLWSRSSGKKKPNIHVEFVPQNLETTTTGDTQRPVTRQISMRMV
uniref:leucine-rich repeat and immunoglobulin-like domain-containing nogo receptor-interacting protein 2 n=1 Tax=Myxine glutinosa TaxID=7769 RepID=UPI00358F96DB